MRECVAQLSYDNRGGYVIGRVIGPTAARVQKYLDELLAIWPDHRYDVQPVQKHGDNYSVFFKRSNG
jgi:hypothetical protein